MARLGTWLGTWLGTSVWLTACVGPGASSVAPAAPAPAPAPAPVDPFAQIPYADAPLPEDAKVFLVAGGDDIGNFAAEIVEQRSLWQQAGLRDEEIACYYAKPNQDALQRDADQLAGLAPRLRDCYPADPATLHEHLRQAAARHPPFLYLYVSSHGLPPLLRWKAEVTDVADLPHVMALQPGEVGHFDRHAIGLEAGDGPGLGEVDAVLQAHRAGIPVDHLVLTPDTLAAALAELPDTSRKILVLQACFSGGFIGRPDDDGPSPLARMPHMTLLTATSPSRPSFGCDAGAARTYYGGAFNRVLADVLATTPGPPPALPWREIHERVRFVVETMETIEGERPSEPSLLLDEEVPSRAGGPPSPTPSPAAPKGPARAPAVGAKPTAAVPER